MVTMKSHAPSPRIIPELGDNIIEPGETFQCDEPFAKELERGGQFKIIKKGTKKTISKENMRIKVIKEERSGGKIK